MHFGQDEQHRPKSKCVLEGLAGKRTMDGLAELDYKGCPENYMKIRPKELLGLNINPVSVLLHFKMWKPWKDYE